MPRYLSKDGHFICVFTKDMIKIEDDKVSLSMGWNFTKKYDVRYLYFTIPRILGVDRLKRCVYCPVVMVCASR